MLVLSTEMALLIYTNLIIDKKGALRGQRVNSALGGSRTHTSLRTHAPETCASTSSATKA